MIDLKLDVPDLLIEVFVSPMRLCLTSKNEPIEVVTVEVLEDILGANEIPYAIKGRCYGEENIPYELEVLFNRLYSGVMLNQLAKALQTVMVDKGFKVIFR